MTNNVAESAIIEVGSTTSRQIATLVSLWNHTMTMASTGFDAKTMDSLLMILMGHLESIASGMVHQRRLCALTDKVPVSTGVAYVKED